MTARRPRVHVKIQMHGTYGDISWDDALNRSAMLREAFDKFSPRLHRIPRGKAGGSTIKRGILAYAAMLQERASWFEKTKKPIKKLKSRDFYGGPLTS